MAKEDINDFRKLNDFRIRMLKLLTEDTIITKKTFKVEKTIENGEEIQTRVPAGNRAITCRNSGNNPKNDWKIGNNLYRGNSSRERVRLVLQELKKIAQEARKFSLELDKKAKKS